MARREIPVTQARADLAELVNRVAYSGEQVVLTRHGKPVAALVSAEDLELLDRLAEEHIDLTATGPAEHRHGAQPQAEPLRIAAHYRPGGPSTGGSPGGPGDPAGPGGPPHRPGFRG